MFRLPAGVRNLSFLQLAQSENGADPTCYSAGKGDPSLGINLPGCEANRSPLSSA